MNIVLYARNPVSTPEEMEALQLALVAVDEAAGGCAGLGSGGPAHRPGLIQALTHLSASEVEEVHAQSQDRLARTRPQLEALHELLDRHGLALKFLEEDAEVHEQGGR
jgi:DNA invertase Pin-like site-specific DNA recombinase